ncbi:MAG: transcriptional repressor [Planctomycetota bacterium]
MALEPLPPMDSTDDYLDAVVPEIVAPLCAVFRKRLKDEGLKYTPERAAVLEAIIRIDGLFEAEQLIDDVKDMGHRVSKATVYRTIKLMQEAGLLQRILLHGEHPRYQLVYGQRPVDLLIRMDTDEAEPIELPELIELRDRLCRERGLIPKGHRLIVYAEAPTEGD